jgi:hypothetical protein
VLAEEMLDKWKVCASKDRPVRQRRVCGR